MVEHELKSAHLLTRSSSVSLARGLSFGQRSIANSVEELLKMDVSDEMTAASMHAIIRPRRPAGRQTETQRCKQKRNTESKCWTQAVVVTSDKLLHCVGGCFTCRQQFLDEFWVRDVGAADRVLAHGATDGRVRAADLICNQRLQHVSELSLLRDCS